MRIKWKYKDPVARGGALLLCVCLLFCQSEMNCLGLLVAGAIRIEPLGRFLLWISGFFSLEQTVAHLKHTRVPE